MSHIMLNINNVVVMTEKSTQIKPLQAALIPSLTQIQHGSNCFLFSFSL